MALRISDLPGGSLTKKDYLEIESYSGRVSYKITAEQMAQLCKLLNNGGFRGQETSKSLDDFTWMDAGVYWWEGTAPISGMPSTGILEIITTAEPDETLPSQQFIQRLTNGDSVYTRMVDGTIRSAWGVLKNNNGNKILSGVSSDASVNFNTITGRTASNPFFNQAPVVTVTPINSDPSFVGLVQVTDVDQSHFSVSRYTCTTRKPTTTTTTREQSSVTVVSDGAGNDKSNTTVTEKTEGLVEAFGGWEAVTGSENDANTFSYYWIATVDG